SRTTTLQGAATSPWPVPGAVRAGLPARHRGRPQPLANRRTPLPSVQPQQSTRHHLGPHVNLAAARATLQERHPAHPPVRAPRPSAFLGVPAWSPRTLHAFRTGMLTRRSFLAYGTLAPELLTPLRTSPCRLSTLRAGSEHSREAD